MKFRDKRPVALDLNHMKLLHTEAADQLELMQTSLQAAENGTGSLSDTLDQIALNHWHAYLDVMHMIEMQEKTRLHFSSVVSSFSEETAGTAKSCSAASAAVNLCVSP